MKQLEGLCLVVVVAIAITMGYFATRNSFVEQEGMYNFVDFLMGFVTYAAYLCLSAQTCNTISKWFKAVHWDKLEELKKVEKSD